MLIGFTGPAGVGKDEAARRLNLLLPHYDTYAFAKPIKAALATLGFQEPKTREEKESLVPGLGSSYRRLAQTLGTEWGRDCIRPDFWLWLAKQRAAKQPNLLVTDVRFENEAVWIRESGGLMVHVEGRETTVTGQEATHASEAGIAVQAGAYLLPNFSGLTELDHQVRKLAIHITEL